MVNPINNNYPTEYQPSAGKTVKVDNDEPFSLNSALGDNGKTYDGVLYEPSEQKQSETGTSSHTGSSSGTSKRSKDTFESSLDKAIKEREEIERNDAAFQKAFRELWGNVSSFFSSLWHNIRKVFGNLWESKPLADGMESIRKDTVTDSTENNHKDSVAGSTENILKDTASDGVESLHTDNLSEQGIDNETASTASLSSIDALEAERDSKIRQALSEGNRDEFRALISDDGKRLPAHNTTMLTTYDASGKLVNLNPSDENKILHGDRGAKKL